MAIKQKNWQSSGFALRKKVSIFFNKPEHLYNTVWDTLRVASVP